MVILESIITCPECGYSKNETMPIDACQFFYECKGCGVLLQPNHGDCCVFCSFGSIACPPIQNESNNDNEARCCRSLKE